MYEGLSQRLPSFRPYLGVDYDTARKRVDLAITLVNEEIAAGGKGPNGGPAGTQGDGGTNSFGSGLLAIGAARSAGKNPSREQYNVGRSGYLGPTICAVTVAASPTCKTFGRNRNTHKATSPKMWTAASQQFHDVLCGRTPRCHTWGIQMSSTCSYTLGSSWHVQSLDPLLIGPTVLVLTPENTSFASLGLLKPRSSWALRSFLSRCNQRARCDSDKSCRGLPPHNRGPALAS
jgi:hypothetical protein